MVVWFSSVDNSWVRWIFGAKCIITIIQWAPALSYDTTRFVVFCHIVGVTDQNTAS